ncbi:MAG TPA: amidohydrolase [Fimbriimonas sp.]|nr:amidohydrolase [Fimbriimonas sp.]
MRQVYTNFRWWETGEPQTMVVDEGKVVSRGIDRAPAAETIDLGGQVLMPSFIDSHCHILPTGLDLKKLNLTTASSHQEVLDLVAQRLRVDASPWLLAVHYDQTKYADGRHLTRDELDQLSQDRPILLRHTSGHASVANSAALRAAGVDESTPDPGGGRFGRDASGRLDGTLFEEAHERVSHAPPTPTAEEMADAILAAGEKMSALGIACASDMMTGRYDLEREIEAYRLASLRGCKIKMRLYLQWKEVFGPRARPLSELQEKLADLERQTLGRVRAGGIKIFSDGAIGSATAAIYGRYSGETPAGPVLSRRAKQAAHEEREVSGQLMYSPEKLIEMTRIASDAGYQVSVHAIGDYASDLVMDAFEATGDPTRHRLEHGMILSDSQIERLAGLGCFLTFQPEFLMRFGHAYRRQLGPERAARLKRTRSVLDAGIRLSFSSDRPIVPGDPLDGIETAVNRPEGFDPTEACTWEEAVRAYTVEGARANGDGAAMGALEPGMDADFQIRSADARSASGPASP